MNFAFCLDDNYVMPYLVCLTSLYENNKNEICDVYIVTTGLKKENIDKFKKLSTIYNQQVYIKQISTDLYKNLPYDETYSFATYNRFMIPSVVEVSKIIYLDGDIIVRGKLKELWNVNVEGYAAAAVEDQMCDDIIMHNRLRIDGSYYNSGVQVLNLDYWRHNQIPLKLINYLHKYPERCKYMDQDAANANLGDKIRLLDYKYNFQEQWFNSFENSKMHYRKWHKIEEARLNPIIVHFCSKMKPWYKECTNPYKSEFVQYAKMYDFVGYRETRYHSVGFRMVYPFFYFFSGLLSKFK